MTYQGCTSINGILRIADINGQPTNIANLNGLTQLTHANQLIVANNPNLVSLLGLDNIDFNGVSKISISDNTSLDDISDLASNGPLMTAGDFAIKNSPNIDENDLSILQNVTTFGTGLQLTKIGIKNIDFLSSVISIARSLVIKENPNLETLTGFTNLTTFPTGLNANLDIHDNPKLLLCNSICDILKANLGTNTLINISNNAGPCETLTTLLTSCLIDGNGGIYSGNGITPSTTTVTITDELNFDGDIGISGQIFGLSDERLKESPQEIENALEVLNQLNPTEYKFKSSKFLNLNLPEKQQYGLMAQEVEKVLPSLVKELEMKDGAIYKSVNYQGLISILIAAINEQQLEIEKLKVKIED